MKRNIQNTQRSLEIVWTSGEQSLLSNLALYTKYHWRTSQTQKSKINPNTYRQSSTIQNWNVRRTGTGDQPEFSEHLLPRLVGAMLRRFCTVSAWTGPQTTTSRHSTMLTTLLILDGTPPWRCATISHWKQPAPAYQWLRPGVPELSIDTVPSDNSSKHCRGRPTAHHHDTSTRSAGFWAPDHNHLHWWKNRSTTPCGSPVWVKIKSEEFHNQEKIHNESSKISLTANIVLWPGVYNGRTTWCTVVVLGSWWQIAPQKCHWLTDLLWTHVLIYVHIKITICCAGLLQY